MFAQKLVRCQVILLAPFLVSYEMWLRCHWFGWAGSVAWVGWVRLVRLVGLVGWICCLVLSGNTPNGQTHHPSSRENNFLEEVIKKNARRLSWARWKGKQKGEQSFLALFSIFFGISRLSTEVISSILEISIDVPTQLIDWRVNGLYLASWWFQIFVIFTPIWGKDPIWLIFFRWVETTN